MCRALHRGVLSENCAFKEDGVLNFDWGDLDRRADWIIRKYSVVTGAWNVLPPPFDLMGVAGTFSKMATELAGVYQVMMPGARARQIGWAMASGTASVLGVTYVGSRLLKLVPGAGVALSLLVQAPVVAAVAYASGEVLKDYFKKARAGKELTVNELKESFVRTLTSRVGYGTSTPAVISGDQGFCAYCGGKLVEGGTFCPGCGHRVGT
jgi:uncharacterized protein (DUF697 family)